MLIVRSPVRISFGGGGTDLPAYYETFGGAVLSATIDKYFYTIVSRRTDKHVQIISSELRASESWENIKVANAKGHPLEIPLAILQELGREVAVDIFLASDVPHGTGLGSSASVCVSVLHAMTSYLQLPLTQRELAEKAFHIATHVLHKPVGKQDEYAAAFGGLNLIRFNPDGGVKVEPLNLPQNITSVLQSKLMLFFTGSTRDSCSILHQQQAATRSGHGSALESLHRIRELADQMHETLLVGDLHRFGLLLHEGWESKKTISSMISNPTIDSMYALARANGATGGKITGAGGGGFMLLYCDNEKQPAVRKAFLEQGIREMRFGFDFGGSRVLVNELSAGSDHIENESASASVTSRRKVVAGRHAK